MATAVQKITLSSSRDIPFNKLVLSQSNVRRVKAGISVEELAESIARRGLIQSLHVRPVVDAEGKETGMFEVPAGGRRFRALELLVKACPAGLYKKQDDGSVRFDYAGCLECGTCRILGLGSALEQWEYPRGTFGVEFRYG